MSIIRKIIILIFLICVIYILYRLIQKRKHILEIIHESFTNIPDIESKKVMEIASKNNVPNTIVNASKNPKNKSKPLSSFQIKSSMNSAYDGTAVSTDMIVYVLSRGYRFLDFEVYYDTESNIKEAVIGYSDNGSFPASSNVDVPLSDALKTVLLNAFSKPAPNSGDPLFIQIRPMYQLLESTDNPETTNKKIGNNLQLNTQIQRALAILESERYKDKVSENTNINDIMRKIIIVMDTTSNKMNIKSAELISMVNMSPQNKAITTYNIGNSDSISEVSGLLEIIPYDANHALPTMNPYPFTIIGETKCNILPMMAWMTSYIGGYEKAGLSELGEYESMFNNGGGSAFIQIDEAISYSSTHDTSKLKSQTLSM